MKTLVIEFTDEEYDKLVSGYSYKHPEIALSNEIEILAKEVMKKDIQTKSNKYLEEKAFAQFKESYLG